MKRDSNGYIFVYSAVMVVVVASLLALAATVLKPAQLANVRMEKRLDILSSVGVDVSVPSGVSKGAYVDELYGRYIVESVVVGTHGRAITGCQAFDLDLRGELACAVEERRLPVFIARLDDGSRKYIFPLSGQGLWGPIWGYIALNDDLNTVHGVSFAHKGETPGLGAEIVADWFRARFVGKRIFQGQDLVSIALVKGGAQASDAHRVDGISGSTMTNKGVEAMLKGSLQEYRSYINLTQGGGQGQ